MKYYYILLVILGLIIVAVAIEIYRETHSFKVTRYKVRTEKLSGIARDVRLIFLSDLHNWTYGSGNEKLLRSVRREKPDLILVGGDMLVGKEDTPYDTALHLLQELSAICPVVCANGNHEQRMKEDPEKYGGAYAEYKNALKKSGVCILENQSVRIELGDKELVIYGLELPMDSYRRFKKQEIPGEDIKAYLGELPVSKTRNAGKGRYTILLAHNPTYMQAYLDWGADMVLSGHLHGGLVRIPGVGGIVTPQGFLFPKYSGEMTREGEQTVIVSRGLGTHTLNIRLFNMPELIFVRLSDVSCCPEGREMV